MVLLKILHLIETVLFVLRKKKNQISFLHVYHHISTILFGLIFIRYIPGGRAVFYPLLNGSVHVIMYSCYFLSSIEEIKKAVLPIKRYITIIQMAQFVFLLLQAFVSLSPSCSVPKLPVILMIPNILLNFLLFYHFYRKAYLNPRKTKEEIHEIQCDLGRKSSLTMRTTFNNYMSLGH
ncbi:elongation of very long chain fatty acids protein F-like [Belonocnema kinseyi]|uniref:elongation of very long chain fatty acids protein F-like n=1 Tax=Belonocnema kinseyi TaxID=2817044 RepID=UPI00143DAC30|nr:elongation of very long chain fatty acids protein F-like [Belonocnema kinseyi]